MQTQAHYKKQRDVLYGALLEEFREYFPNRINFAKPVGGMFIWLEVLDENAPNPNELLDLLAVEKIVVVPSDAFFIPNVISDETDVCKCAMRLTFAAASSDDMIQGVSRLGRSLKNALNRK